ncbi:unnamed protein product [Blepharisma stoltei]|uniref:Uncharacterized protein n=1 Tax=Blepharisma stoltei TaxID=1481888 RepID=A0AAU9JUX0_9CILI|nr:unnamed protein product [Blepharisma stoltei]
MMNKKTKIKKNLRLCFLYLKSDIYYFRSLVLAFYIALGVIGYKNYTISIYENLISYSFIFKSYKDFASYIIRAF